MNKTSPQQNLFKLKSLTIDSKFDSGNLLRAEERQDKQIEIWLSHDAQNTEYQKHYRTWFYFRVTLFSAGPTTFHINNLNNQSTLFKYGMQPVYKSESMKSFQRLPDKSVFKHNEGNEHELTFRHSLPDNDSYVYFAFTYPWSYEDDQAQLQKLQDKALECAGLYFQRELMTYSLEKRRIDLLTITSHKGITQQEEGRPKQLFPEAKRRPPIWPNKQYVVLTGRVHPGEVPASHIMNGVLNYLIGDMEQDQRALLLDNFVFLIVPIINPDGVARGHYRVDTLGQNLNRFYMNPTHTNQPSIYAIQQIFLQVHQRQQLYFYMDFHAHAGQRGVFAFGNALPFRDHLQTVLFNKILSLNNKDFDYYNCNFTEKNMYAKDKGDMLSKEGAGRVALYKQTGLKHCYTLEANYNQSRYYNKVPPFRIRSVSAFHKTTHRHKIYQQVEDDRSLLEFMLKPRKDRDVYVQGPTDYYVVEDYHQVGISVLDSLLDLLRSDGLMRIPEGVQTIRSRLWDGSYQNEEIVKYSLALDLIKGPPFKFDNYLRKYMKYLVYNNQDLEVMANALTALKSMHQYLIDNQKRDIVPSQPTKQEKNAFMISSKVVKNNDKIGLKIQKSSSTLIRGFRDREPKSSSSERKTKKEKTSPKKNIISKNMNMNNYKLPPLPAQGHAIKKIDMTTLVDHMAHCNAPIPIKQPNKQKKGFKNKSRVLKSQK